MTMEAKKTLSAGFTLHGKKDYTVVSVLGQGGYGITYLAQHTQQGHNIPDKYAIKEFFMNNCCRRNPDGSVTMTDTESKSAKEYRKSFRLEAEHLMDLNQYAGIVHVQEIFETNGTVYYVMEHLGDTSLSSLLASSGGRLNEDLSIQLVESVGKSLAQLHQKKMNHLDVKPDNIMLVGEATQMQPVLIDFGLSRHYNNFGLVTDDNAAFGVSDGYSPAEQYVGLDSFSPTADVYALAATLFHMLTGHAPERATKITEAYLSKELSGKASDKCITAIVKAMRMNTAERTQSVNEFLADMGVVIDGTNRGGTVDINVIIKKRWIRAVQYAAVIVLAGAAVMFTRECQRGGKKTEPIKIDTLTHQPATAPVNTQTESVITVEPNPVAANTHGTNTHATVTTHDDSVTPTPPAPQKGTIDLGYGVWNGEMRQGKPHGLGTMTYKTERRVDSRDPAETYAAAGDKMEGEFRNGHWEYGTLYNKAGTPKAKLSIGSD